MLVRLAPMWAAISACASPASPSSGTEVGGSSSAATADGSADAATSSPTSTTVADTAESETAAASTSATTDMADSTGTTDGRDRGALCDPSPYANLLFCSGFEAGTSLSSVASDHHGGAGQIFSGIDESTGFDWSPDFVPLRDDDPFWINNIPGEGAPEPLAHYMTNAIVEVPDRFGRPTRALFSELLEKHQAVSQISLDMQYDLSVEPPPMYFRYWFKPSPALFANITPGEWQWDLLLESKTDTTEFRFQWMVGTNGDPSVDPFYIVSADTCSESQCNDPVHWRYEVPMTVEERNKWANGEWMAVEVYVHRNPADHADGRFVVAIDDRVLQDVSAADHQFWGPDNRVQSFWILLSLYGVEGSEHLDDLEIWDGIPCEAMPCGGPGA